MTSSVNYNSGDFYERLGVSKDSQPGEIKKAYFSLTKKYHPDKNNNEKWATEAFQNIAEAYATLSDPEKRKVYDLSTTTSNRSSQSSPTRSRPSSTFHNPSADSEAFYAAFGKSSQSSSRRSRPSSTYHKDDFSESANEAFRKSSQSSSTRSSDSFSYDEDYDFSRSTPFTDKKDYTYSTDNDFSTDNKEHNPGVYYTVKLNTEPSLTEEKNDYNPLKGTVFGFLGAIASLFERTFKFIKIGKNKFEFESARSFTEILMNSTGKYQAKNHDSLLNNKNYKAVRFYFPNPYKGYYGQNEEEELYYEVVMSRNSYDKLFNLQMNGKI